ncbi:MAG: hypothetical protein AAF391_13520 [Bacteroidota bacterium]
MEKKSKGGFERIFDDLADEGLDQWGRKGAWCSYASLDKFK